jgi:hypothetical protein
MDRINRMATAVVVALVFPTTPTTPTNTTASLKLTKPKSRRAPRNVILLGKRPVTRILGTTTVAIRSRVATARGNGEKP